MSRSKMLRMVHIMSLFFCLGIVSCAPQEDGADGTDSSVDGGTNDNGNGSGNADGNSNGSGSGSDGSDNNSSNGNTDGNDNSDTGGGSDSTPPSGGTGNPLTDPNASSKDVFRLSVYETSKRNCIDCHGMLVVGQDPKLTLLQLTNGYPQEAYDATYDVVNFFDLNQSPLLVTIQQPGGHPSTNPAITQEMGQAIANEFLPQLTAWKEALARESEEANKIPAIDDGDVNLGQTQYTQQCSGCHGANANANQLGDGESYSGVYGFSLSTHQGNTCDKACANNIGAYLCKVVWANIATQCPDVAADAAPAEALSMPTISAFDYSVNALIGVLPSEHYGSKLVSDYHSDDKILPVSLSGSANNAAKFAVENGIVTTGCEDSESQLDCVIAFIETFGSETFGRPLTGIERVDFAGYYFHLLNEYDEPTATQKTIARFIESKAFLQKIH